MDNKKKIIYSFGPMSEKFIIDDFTLEEVKGSGLGSLLILCLLDIFFYSPPSFT